MKNFLLMTTIIFFVSLQSQASVADFLAMCRDSNLPSLERQSIKAINDAVQGQLESFPLSCEEIALRLQEKKKLYFADHRSSFAAPKEPLGALKPLIALDWIEEISIAYLAEEIGIFDVAPLAKMPALKKLELLIGSQPLVNLDQLSSLESLELNSSQLIDFSHFAKLKELRVTAYHSHNGQIGNFALIDTAIKLEALDVSGYRLATFKDFTIFSKLIALKRLSIAGLDFNRIDSLHELRELQNLEIRNSTIDELLMPEKINSKLLNLELNYVEIGKGVDSIRKFSQLKKLVFTNSQLRYASFLKNLFELEELDLSNNIIGIVNDIAMLTKLRKVDLEKNNLSNSGYFKNLVNMEFLNLSENEFDEIDGVKNMSDLRELNIRKNKIYSIKPLNVLINLNKLTLDDNRISDVSVLENLVGLHQVKSLNLSHNKIFDSQGLASFRKLKELNLSDNSLHDIFEIGLLSELESLVLNRNNLTDISRLGNLTKLSALDLSHNRISDVSPLVSLKNISYYIALSYNNISDISPLEALKGQQFYLHLHENPLTSDYCPAGTCQF
ncbi:MAG: leucine-rich repeat domain-containing protein [Myxococcales bacterium]|nr:leucine-rich repeat domain-containing protein [Myxococcales bacterium]USN50536.1 MAG: leucine-rich repeat domain-containing protein [Myxococcales bacterium]